MSVPNSVLAFLALLQAGRWKSAHRLCYRMQAAAPAALNNPRWRIAQVQEDLRPPAAGRPLLPADAAEDRWQLGVRSVADMIHLSVSDATVARRHSSLEGIRTLYLARLQYWL